MSRKDYVRIATVLKASGVIKFAHPAACAAACMQHEQTIRNIADALADDNSRFDRDRFYKACGLEVGA